MSSRITNVLLMILIGMVGVTGYMIVDGQIRNQKCLQEISRILGDVNAPLLHQIDQKIPSKPLALNQQPKPPQANNDKPTSKDSAGNEQQNDQSKNNQVDNKSPKIDQTKIDQPAHANDQPKTATQSNDQPTTTTDPKTTPTDTKTTPADTNTTDPKTTPTITPKTTPKTTPALPDNWEQFGPMTEVVVTNLFSGNEEAVFKKFNAHYASVLPLKQLQTVMKSIRNKLGNAVEIKDHHRITEHVPPDNHAYKMTIITTKGQTVFAIQFDENNKITMINIR